MGFRCIERLRPLTTDLRLAFLAAPDETGGSADCGICARRLGASGFPWSTCPASSTSDTVPEHRKVNRVDLGTADKLCAAALGIQDQ